MSEDLEKRITEYLTLGGLFNPELMDHKAVSELLRDCRDALSALREKLAAVEGENKELRMQDDPCFTYAFVLRARDAEARATAAEAEVARRDAALQRIANPSTVAGMHEQDRAERLQGIARVALTKEPGE
jgi:hypothetical protein